MAIGNLGFTENAMAQFQTGRSLAGPNPLGVMVQGVLEKVNALQGAQLQARQTGLAEEEKMRGIARFYQSPEGQQYITSLGQRSAAMLGGLSGISGNATQLSSGEPNVSGYIPQYGVTGATVDPLNPEATKYTIGETPQSQVKRAVTEDIGKKVAEVSYGSQILQSRLGDIKSALAQIPPPVPSSLSGSAVASNVVGIGRKFLGRTDPKFRQATTLIEASIGPFLTTVEGLSRGRLTQGEINYLSNMLRDLPYLDEQGRQNRFALIDKILNRNIQFGESSPLQSASPFQPVESLNHSVLPQGFRRR